MLYTDKFTFTVYHVVKKPMSPLKTLENDNTDKRDSGACFVRIF